MPTFLSPVGVIGPAANGGLTVGTNTTTAAGGLWFGTDTNLFRSGANTLRTDGGCQMSSLQLMGGNDGFISRLFATATNEWSFVSRLMGDTTQRFVLLADGQMQWGSGTTARDTNLYRSAADTLKTDDNLVVGARLGVGVSGAPATALGSIVGTLGNLSSTVSGLSLAPTFTPATDNGSDLYVLGLNFTPRFDSPFAKSGFMVGAFVNPVIAGAGTMPMFGVDVVHSVASAVTVSATYGMRVRAPSLAAGAAITTNYGIYINDQKPVGVTNSHGIYFLGTGTGNAINWMGDTNLYRSSANLLATDDTLNAAALSVGTSPAVAGGLRLPVGNGGAIKWRNAANSADSWGIDVDTSDILNLRSTLTKDLRLEMSGSQVLRIGSGGIVFKDGFDLYLGTMIGTKMGSSGSEKLSFWGSSPVTQPTNWFAYMGSGAPERKGVLGSAATAETVGETLNTLILTLMNMGLLNGSVVVAS